MIRAIEAETDRSMRDRLYDAWPVGLQPKKINVATASLAWSEQVFDDVARRGRSCQLIDAIPWALARATLLASPENRGRMLAALDWGYGKATMCLVHQGAPALVRTLKECGFQRILDVIAKSLRLDERDAELLLQKHGLTGGDPEQRNFSSVVENVLREPLSHLIDELRRTLGYWQGLTRGKMPEALYLFGGGAALSGVDRFLNAALDLPVKRWSLAADETVDPELAPPACLLGTAAGLSAAAWETL
jgi:Tfp pilus assembly PilM family ATPase